MSRQPVICLMGPTASGKTEIALQLAQALPVDLISVDSALVYRGMDIGTAKPDARIRKACPHALIDIREPEESYSAGAFVRDAKNEIAAIFSRGRLPLLVGGTMMYFRALISGIADLPESDETIRASIDAEAAAEGWPALHRQLAAVDPEAAARINENDSQRIQRALEVYRASGRSLSHWIRSPNTDAGYVYLKTALVPEPRDWLHARIAARLARMLETGFLDEVAQLQKRPKLTAEHSSMRAVGYRQLWRHLAGECDLSEAQDSALAATRQLAKRQLTWLRSDSDVFAVNPLEVDAFAAISGHIRIGLAPYKY